MSIVAFDWGGTSVKYGFWKNAELQKLGSFPTPESWQQMKEEMLQVKNELAQEDTTGVAISAPGAVDTEAGIIRGISAIDYIHNFPIQAELEALLQLPVILENDANCAGIAEVWQGAARGLQDVLFVVIGTGIGGVVIQDGKIRKGAHLFGGEFGLLFVTEEDTFSEVGTAVKMAWRYSERMGKPKETYSGQQVFEFAATGDLVAIEEQEKFYEVLTRALFGIQFTTDPQRIILGGGVSAKTGFAEEIEGRLRKMFLKYGLTSFVPEVTTCKFHNEANLIGAVATFYQWHAE